MNIYYQASDGNIKSLGDNELAHYNHNHDALGRFAGSVGSVSSRVSSSPKQYKKQLNKLNALSAYGRGRAMEQEYKSGKARSKGDVNTAAKKAKKAKTYREIAAKADSAERRIVKEAVAKNYNVGMKQVRRNSKKGKDIAASLGLVPIYGGVIGAGGYNLAVRAKDNHIYKQRYNGETPRSVSGTKYSVYKNDEKKKKGSVYRY